VRRERIAPLGGGIGNSLAPEATGESNVLIIRCFGWKYYYWANRYYLSSDSGGTSLRYPVH